MSIPGVHSTEGPTFANHVVIKCAVDDPDDNRHTTQDVPQERDHSARGSSADRTPIRLPPFTQEMLATLPAEFYTNPLRIVQGILVRAWFLHHVNIPRSMQSRQIVPRGSPQHWRAQIISLWSDFLLPGEDITVDLVRPSPRNWHETSILFDLILAQGLYAGRVSGLVILPPSPSHR